MKNDANGNKICRNCNNCSAAELPTPHTFDCPAILAHQQNQDILPSKVNLYEGNIEQITLAVQSLMELFDCSQKTTSSSEE